ncbi:phosphotransferase [Paractinoplanes atraurantiacus]|uniref:Ser/Thr protein kinase RdoA involved in Cpx stress response, MazF antagonist n=1 Tax=Paractinoplanes atraurantiacus TaxID=1036182 RepID=A0A285K8A0_9ACTN|nr:phosphotransferase [Actinoplanes atraurantiacus]SNY68795.1 Ser/Thr protein kinase RdoA involved in Cpx stress response, MazF antagonist [Actinoplanes atraurantiacus]
MDGASISTLFGLGRFRRLSDGPVARGRQGEVWRLDTSDGRWAVKVPFHPQAFAGGALQEKACAAGVPAPAVRRTVDGALFGDKHIRVYEWVELGPPDPLMDPELVGATVAAIHRVFVPAHGPVEAWHTAPVGAARWDELIALVHEAPFAARLAALRDELVALEEWLTPPATLQMCHRDLWADNVLPTPDGGLCVIDWENSGPADPAQELACVLFEFGRTDPGRARALMSSYIAAGGPARISRVGDFSMLIAQLGHIAELAGSNWLSAGARPESAAWIGEVLEDFHSRERLQGLLRAIRPHGL